MSWTGGWIWACGEKWVIRGGVVREGWCGVVRMVWCGEERGGERGVMSEGW